MVVLARLGFWQLDRLEQRRAQNQIVAASLAASPVDLSSFDEREQLPDMKDRQVIASGVYDLANQLVLKVQNWEGRAGAHLITPLLLDGGETAVLVDRGWIPEAENNPQGRAQYDVDGQVTIEGYVALSQRLSRRETSAPDEAQTEWYRVDIEAIQPQMPYELLPIYVLQAPDEEQALPYRRERVVELSEGSHFSNAMQWFIFCVGLGIAYVVYVRKDMLEGKAS
jgi:surfeit locus 1 family protein